MAIIVGFLVYGAPARAETTIEITGLASRDLQSRFFLVDGDIEVRVDAVGAALGSGEDLFAYPWILDAKTRALVWSMEEEITSPVGGSDWLRHFSGDVRLRRGAYELYYYAGWPSCFSGGVEVRNLSEVFQRLAELLGRPGRNDKDGTLRSLSSQFNVRLTGDSAVLRETPKGVKRKALISILHPDNNTYEHEGFTLKRDLDLDVYCLGEYSESGDAMVDWGWIVDANSSRRVWEMTRDNTDLAGGATKNRRFHDRVRLPRGDYVAFYVTDDSHTYDDWNSPPPYDPEAWGLQISPVSDLDRTHVVAYDEKRIRHPLVQLVGIGDNELRSQAFRLTRPAKLRIYAIGEYDKYDKRMADYAWIVLLPGKPKVWEMSVDNTEPAGGARKNVKFDGVIDLDAGDYLLYYSSDGSHSYAGGWNASPPHDQKSYGVTVYPAATDFDSGTVVIIEKAGITTAGLIAAITAVGDGESHTQRFTLESPTRVHIHAVGEGSRSGMSDYGWIEDVATGDVVWEMTYRKTAHAGGAEKNRELDQTILLDKGEYLLRFVTDDSHAFGAWNAAPPSDPAAWGITLTLAGKLSN